MKTTYISEEELRNDRKWFVVDASDKVLGRLATQVAVLLRGKHKTYYAPHQDTGDFVVVLNAEKVRLTGTKSEYKSYFSHSQYPGGGKTVSFKRMIERHPDRVIKHAVKGMLPKNALGRKIMKKLKVYAGDKHPHAAQQPVEFKI